MDRYTRGVLPMKLYEYLASGKPVVSTRLPELEPFEDLVDLCGDAMEFINAIEKRLAEDRKTDVKKRIELARVNSWDKRIHGILKLLEETLKAGKHKK
jgi:hypothetical protein